jgi:DNA (cytosine-5)-methyltransferase 1
MHLFPYKWNLADGYPAKGITKNNYNVFGTFICGGGSTMGYKLAGFNHLGGVEIDPKIAKVYQLNHKPKYLYLEDIREFVKRSDIPKELYNLDLLDGSPPCSSFSMSGNREKDWGKKKVFKEGQAEQVLDDLFFEYIALAKKLQPKIVLAENVKGLIQGNAKLYVKKIFAEFDKAGYNVQLFLLNAASMGVPQKRERVFFICQRKDLNLPKLKLEFNEESIPFSEISCDSKEFEISEYREKWIKTEKGKCFENRFSTLKINEKEVLPTITASQRKSFYTGFLHPKQCRKLNDKEFMLGGSYPLDYDFLLHNTNNENFVAYLIGMSVPPVMTAQIANQIKIQWLDKIKL